MMNNRRIDTLVVIVVNAATSPAAARDQGAAVPGLVDTLTTAATVPLDNYTADTLDLISASVNDFNAEQRLIEGCRQLAARLGPQCVPDIPAPQKVALYPIEVSFDYIASPDERRWFRNLPTSFELPAATVDRLRAIGRRLLAEDPQFGRLMRVLQGALPVPRARGQETPPPPPAQRGS